MAMFSQRYGYRSPVLQLECAPDILRGRIYSIFYKKEFDIYDPLCWDHYTTGIEDMMIKMGVDYELPRNKMIKKQNSSDLRNYLMSIEWYDFFDFVEKYLNYLQNDDAVEMQSKFNEVLEEEMSGYRIVNKQVIPVVDECELKSIEDAVSIPYESARIHIQKAIDNFANREKPDYENSIKDSISAVEAMCCIITGNDKATLGEALKQLETKGVHLHKAFKNAMSSLYGYTSDESGIRHGSVDFAGASREDAKFMLITCSAFVNYLIEKWEKVK